MKSNQLFVKISSPLKLLKQSQSIVKINFTEPTTNQSLSNPQKIIQFLGNSTMLARPSIRPRQFLPTRSYQNLEDKEKTTEKSLDSPKTKNVFSGGKSNQKDQRHIDEYEWAKIKFPIPVSLKNKTTQ